MLIVAVWDASGQPLDGASLTATTELGGMKAVPQSSGLYMFDGAGIAYGDFVKVSVDVEHATWGADSIDMLFTASPILRLELVYDSVGDVTGYSPQATTPPSSGPGDGVPANDDCANATSIGLGATNGSTVGATLSGPDTCGTAITAPGVWYSVTGTGNTMTVSTCSGASNYDSKLSVFCGGCETLNCVGGNDDDCGTASGLLSTVTWCSQLGAEYLVLVHGFNADTGDFALLVSDDGAACSDALACLPVGACCQTDGSCDQNTAIGCAAAGGTYSGDGVDCFGLGASSTHGSAPNAAIPDFDLIGLSDSIAIADNGSLVGDVNVELFVNHTWQGDLIVTLTHEDTGTSAVIMDRNGFPDSAFGCGEDDIVGAILDDEGTASIEAQCAPNLTSPPSYTPFGDALSAFDGESLGGTWTLNISDNAEFDTGTLVSWSMTVTEAGEPVCEQPECFLVIGDGPGTGSFTGAAHEFETQVGPTIEDSFPVLMTDIPSFVLPAKAKRGASLGGQVSMPGGPASELEPWMQDGQFAVQVLMWNPGVFPSLPEQFTACLDVEILPNGSVKTTSSGESLGGLEIAAEIDWLPDGTRVISFPFVIPGF
jgi:subtilisin-like proprotein convertase family protein